MGSFHPGPKQILIIANGAPLTGEHLRHLADKASLIIGVDGGTQQAIDAGLRVDLVLGDLDSLKTEVVQKLKGEGQTQFRTFAAEKDWTDTELALQEVLRYQPAAVTVASGVGNRLDHSLANLLLLAKYAPYFSALDLITVSGSVYYLCSSRPALDLWLEPGQLFSVIALGFAVSGVTIINARYPLYEVELPFGSTLGISNIAVAAPVRIGLATGTCVVIVPKN